MYKRQVSLFGIVALGVMMLTGLMSFAPSMRIAGQKYYVQQNVFDLRVLSTPVSYTHLDVYKRQVETQRSPSARMPM